MARKRVKVMKAHLLHDKRRRVETQKQSLIAAPPFVCALIQETVQALTRRYCKRVFKVSANMSGVLCVVAVYKLARTSRRPLELCPSCRTQSSVRVFRPHSYTTETQRAPCTCQRVQCEEQWLLRIYNTLTKHTQEQILSIRDVQAVIEKVQLAVHMMDGAYIRSHLVGSSFGVLQPLFDFAFTDPETGRSSIPRGPTVGTSPSFARLRARDEASVLPLLPLTQPPKLAHMVNTQTVHEEVKPFYTVSQGPRTVSEFYGPVVENDPSLMLWDWQPLHDMEHAALNKERYI